MSYAEIRTHLSAALDLLDTLHPPAPSFTPIASSADLAAALTTVPAGTLLKLTGDLTDPLVLQPRDGMITIDAGGFWIPSVTTAAEAQYYTILGLTTQEVKLGTGLETSVAQVPKNITFDGLTILGLDTGQKRGVALHGVNLQVLNSSITNIKYNGQDAQAIWINNGPGPYVVRNCILEASGENLMVGGDTIRIPDCLASDILIEDCTLSKPLSWKGTVWDVKNLLELKQGRRVTIRRCTLDGNWHANQNGYAVLFTPKDGAGLSPWVAVEDVLMEDCTLTNVSSGFNISALGSSHPIAGMSNITLRRINVTADKTLHGGDGRFAIVGGPFPGLVMEDCLTDTNGAAPIYFVGGQTDGVFRRNTWVRKTYGFWAEGIGEGNLALAPTAVFEGNTMIGGSLSKYPAGTLCPAA